MLSIPFLYTPDLITIPNHNMHNRLISFEIHYNILEHTQAWKKKNKSLTMHT